MTQNPSPLDAIPATYLGTLSAETNAVERPVIAGGPFGTRTVATVSAASFVGPRINATMPEGSAAGDWLTIRDDGTMALDVRLCVRTDDGADIYVTYYGVGVVTDGVAKIRTAPRFETGDERYAWLNNVLGVGLGRRTETGVEYDIYTID